MWNDDWQGKTKVILFAIKRTTMGLNVGNWHLSKVWLVIIFTLHTRTSTILI
jgi:hypothetical protein